MFSIKRFKPKVFGEHKAVLIDKIKEALVSVVPIIVIVLALCLTVAPVSAGLLLAFLIGAAMVILGMSLFTIGSEMSMATIGTRIGSALTKSKKLLLILGISFILGIAITVAEPDLQVLAATVPHIDNFVLLLTVGIGVGFFLSLSMFRIIVGIELRWLLLGCYALVFVLAAFSDQNFLSVAFDSGGVTTGPMTVPFILALGVGVSHIRSDRRASSDSFGLVALCSIGPILAVLLLSFFYGGDSAAAVEEIMQYENTVALGKAYISEIPHYLGEMAVSLSPIIVIFLAFQLFSFRMSGRTFFKILIGVLYTYAGLVLFLTGVNVGFSSLGTTLGAELATGGTRFLLIPLAMLLGWFIISAEPAVYVLEKQIEEVSSGAIPGKAIKLSLSVAISVAMGLAMLRVLTGISIMWFLMPGYAIALILSFFVPNIYTAIAFDSGGVASGPMTATFMLQFMMGACGAVGGNVLSDAFGIVALVAMMPLISIQIMGFIYERKKAEITEEVPVFDDEIIELWPARKYEVSR